MSDARGGLCYGVVKHLMAAKNFQRRRGSFSGAVFTAALGLFFLLSDSDLMQSIFPAGRRLAELSYDLPFAWRSDIAVSNVVILFMDRPSHQRLAQKDFLNWDRTLHARLLRRLKEWRVRAVVFDVLFDETTNPVPDEALVEAARDHGRVAVAALHKLVVAPAGVPIGYRLEEPFLALMDAVVWGVPEAAYEDRIVREHVRDPNMPSLARQAASLAGPIHLESSESRWINYYGPPGWIPHHSYVDILESELDWTAALSNKVVFVGALWDVGFTGGKGTDDFRTPYTRTTHQMSPGVEVTATAYLNLVNHDWLKRLPPWLEALTVAGIGVMLGLGLMGRGPRFALVLGMGAAGFILAASLVLVWTWHIWFPWLIPVGIQIPVAVAGASIARVLQLQREKRVLERELIWSGPEVHAASSRFSGPPPAASITEPSPMLPVIPNHTLLRRVAKGGYGEVWLARDILGDYHAVKIIYRNSFKDAAPYEREFGGIKRFTPISRTHPGFIAIFHVGRDDQREHIYYIMELGDSAGAGPDINPDTYAPRTLEWEIRQGKRIALGQCLEWGIALASALERLHQVGFIHRDLKPANIVFVHGQPKIADIGLVTEAAQPGLPTTFLGSQGFIPPEGPGAPAADIYSLGKVIYEMACGMKAEQFPESSPTLLAQMDEEVFFQLNRILLRACATEAKMRYPAAGALSIDLEKLLSEVQKRDGI